MRRTRLVCALLALVAATAGTSGAPRAAAADPSTLFRMLPAGDAVVTVDVPEMLERTLPAVLASRPESRKKLDDNVARLRTDFGVDLHAVRAAAIVGTSIEMANAEWVAVLEGPFDAVAEQGALAASLAAYAQRNPRYSVREERRGSVTVFIVPEVTANGATIDRFAVAVLDRAHVAWGSPSGVRGAADVHDGKAPGLPTTSPAVEAWSASGTLAPVRFGLVLPQALLKDELARDKDNPLWTSLVGIQYLFGTAGLANDRDVALRVTARSATAANSKSTAATFQALVEMGKSAPSADIAALFALVTIVTDGADVTMSALVPPAQQEPLFRQLTK